MKPRLVCALCDRDLEMDERWFLPVKDESVLIVVCESCHKGEEPDAKRS